MKKLNIITASLMLIFPLLFIQPLKAALLTDIDGTWIDLGGEGAVTGGGISLLWDLPRYFNDEKVFFYISTTYAYSKKNQDEPAKTERAYVPVSAGFEYRHQVFQIPLYVTGSAGAGVSYFRREGPLYNPTIDPSKTQIDSATGPYTNFMIGLNYVLTQNIAVFAKGGYQKSFYNEDKIESPAGFQFAAGLRFPISESFRSFQGVDDIYEDTGPVKFRDTGKRRYVRRNTLLEFSSGAIIPLGKFSEMAETGLGGMFSYMINNIFVNGFTSGIELGYFYLPGKDEIETKGENIHRFNIIPAAVKTGYPFKLIRSLSVTPSLSLGAAYIDSTYTSRDRNTMVDTEKSSKGFDPMIAGSLSLDYTISRSLVAGINAGYGVLIEKDMRLQFASCGINTGIKF